MMASGTPCTGMDDVQPVLCHQHGTGAAQSFEAVKLPTRLAARDPASARGAAGHRRRRGALRCPCRPRSRRARLPIPSFCPRSDFASEISVDSIGAGAARPLAGKCPVRPRSSHVHSHLSRGRPGRRRAAGTGAGRTAHARTGARAGRAAVRSGPVVACRCARAPPKRPAQPGSCPIRCCAPASRTCR